MSLGLGNSDALGVPFDAQRRVYRAPGALFANAGAVTISGTAYFVYMGCEPFDRLVKHVELVMTTNGVGAQTAEVALCRTPDAPNKSTKTFTVLVASGTLDSMTAGATKVVRNTTAFNTTGYNVPAGTHLWAALRTAMGSTQPVIRWVLADYTHGFVQTTAAASALAAGNTYTGALVAASGNSAPDLSLALD